jgi:hypothetical protein
MTTVPHLEALLLQKSRMPYLHGVKDEAVVSYCDSLTTKEMGFYRLSWKANNAVKKHRRRK